MTQLITATLSSKGQVTLPKKVRALLGVKNAGQLVGFLVDSETHVISLTPLEVTPSQGDFSEEEYRKLLGMGRAKGGKAFRSGKAFLDHLQKL